MLNSYYTEKWTGFQGGAVKKLEKSSDKMVLEIEIKRIEVVNHVSLARRFKQKSLAEQAPQGILVRVFITDLIKYSKNKPQHTFSALKPSVFVPSNKNGGIYNEKQSYLHSN